MNNKGRIENIYYIINTIIKKYIFLCINFN